MLLAPQRHYPTPKALSNQGPKASTACKICPIATIRPRRLAPAASFACSQYHSPHASRAPVTGSHSSPYSNVIRLTLGPVDVKPVTGRLVAHGFDLWR